ncbi:MAG: ORF6N domain-containing protein [Candidatus Omnitrophica bacterium]|nr:ORF6N domain-containing protein [Candidatus Omnitrophota bacterium]
MSVELIATKILMIRGQRVMLDKDLARLYGVSIKALNQAVKRNIQRFPGDFMFLLTRQEVSNLKSQIATSCWQPYGTHEVIDSRSQFVTLNSELTIGQDVRNLGAGKQGKNIKYLPYAFTEQGVAMLSSVLNSERAIRVNIMIMRAFVKLKELLLTHKDLAEKIAALEKKYDTHDDKIQLIFEAIKKLLEPVPESPPSLEPKKPPIGFQKD